MTRGEWSRREFMGLTGFGLVAAAFGERRPRAVAQVAAAGSSDADLLVVNANVYTVEAAVPKAEAFAVRAGRFVAVGSTADIKGLARNGAKTLDAQQMTIVPGFIDCHNHASGNTLLYEVLVGNPFEVEFVTIGSIIQKLRATRREDAAQYLGGRLD